MFEKLNRKTTIKLKDGDTIILSLVYDEDAELYVVGVARVSREPGFALGAMTVLYSPDFPTLEEAESFWSSEEIKWMQI